MPLSAESLVRLIAMRAKMDPEKIAIKYRSETIDYANVEALSNQLAQFLAEKNIGTGDIVALAVDRSAELVILLLAIIKSGAAYLPIDTHLPVARINYMLDDSNAQLLITSEGFQQDTRWSLKTLTLETALSECKKYPADKEFPAPDDDSIAYILYTSGSTGKPKGVLVRHSSLLNFLLSMQEKPGISSEDIVLATTTISFDIAGLEIFLPLISGAQLVIADQEITRDGHSLLEKVLAEGITLMQGTPTMWLILTKTDWQQPLPVKMLCGGEPLTRDLVKELLPKCHSLWNMYGPTETTIWSTIKQITAPDEVITIGKPIHATYIYILDEQQNKLADGEIGEICIGGAGLALGYINKPALTAERFIPDPYSSGSERIYKTGDLGRILPNGEIECLGRIDHQLKIRGYRIETQEIEYQLKQLKNVSNALVTSFKDYFNHVHLVAYIVTTDGIADVNYPIGWREDLKRTLPEYMVPVLYKIIPAMPLTANGKIDRQALPAPMIKENINTVYESPHTGTEISLTKIFQQNVALETIGIKDTFSELGINSLTAVKIIVQIEQEFKKLLPLSVLLQYPTIEKLAVFLDARADGIAYKTLVPMHPEGNQLPLYIVHGIGLNILNLQDMVSHLSPDTPVYGIQALGLDGTSSTPDQISDIARRYLDEILAHNSEGPYIITGYSFGGFIAWEMASQLLKMGKKIAMLGMFDTNLQDTNRRQPILKRGKTKFFRQFHKLNFRAGTFQKDPDATINYLKAYYRTKLMLTLTGIGAIKTYNPDKLPDFMLDIIEKLETAFFNYDFKPLNIGLELFQAQTRLYYVDDPKFYGWGKLALKGVSVHYVPGDHKAMFNFPNNRTLAQMLQNKLDEVNAKTPVIRSEATSRDWPVPPGSSGHSR